MFRTGRSWLKISIPPFDFWRLLLKSGIWEMGLNMRISHTYPLPDSVLHLGYLLHVDVVQVGRPSGGPYFTLRTLKSSFQGDCYVVLRTQGLLQACTLTHHKTQHQLNIWILPAEDCSICLMEMKQGRSRRGLILQGCCLHVGQKPDRHFSYVDTSWHGPQQSAFHLGLTAEVKTSWH